MTFPSGRVALRVVWVDTGRVAVAGNTLHLRIAPHICLALITLPSAVSSPEWQRCHLTILHQILFLKLLLLLKLTCIHTVHRKDDMTLRLSRWGHKRMVRSLLRWQSSSGFQCTLRSARPARLADSCTGPRRGHKQTWGELGNRTMSYLSGSVPRGSHSHS